MSQLPNKSEPKTIRELAAELVVAGDAYIVAWKATLANGHLPMTQRVDMQLAADSASAVMCDARRALTAAQQVVA